MRSSVLNQIAMFAVLVIGLLASACAAPHYHNHHHHHGPPPPPPFRDHGFNPYFSGEMFDTSQFWRDMERELSGLERMLEEFSKHFPTRVTGESIDGDKYKITMLLHGFEEKDIIVKARKGTLMVQAVHTGEGGSQNSYLDVRNLPDCVNAAGSWNYENDVLTIVFPLDNSGAGPEKDNDSGQVVEKHGVEGPVTEQEPITTLSPVSGEELGQTEDESQNVDADVGAGRGDLNAEVLTNEILPQNRVEATTYAVDLKDEYEFVPIKF